jgi:hypothetical protein
MYDTFTVKFLIVVKLVYTLNKLIKKNARMLFEKLKYCSSNLRWPLRMRRRGSAMQDVEP